MFDDKDDFMGAPVCTECNLSYVVGLEEDERKHAYHHDRAVNGVPSERLPEEPVIWEDGDFRITAFAHNNSVQRVRHLAQEVSSMFNMETHFSFGIYDENEEGDEDSRNAHVFLLHHQDRVVGFLLLERQASVWRIPWSVYDSDGVDYDKYGLPDHPPMWSICFVGVLKKWRRQRLATLMIREALIFLGETLHSVGWHTPFKRSGKALCQSLCPEEFYVAI
jgi:GNAT superfamily N-acetyltransferase